MSNKTKRDIFEQVLADWRDFVFDVGYQGEELHGWSEFDAILYKYQKDYRTALPDNLPTILECVSKEIKAGYGKYSLLDELAWANQNALPSSKVSEWIDDNETLFAEAWSRGIWVVEETGEVTSYDD